MAEASLEKSKKKLESTLGTGAITIVRKEIEHGTAVVQDITLRCTDYATQIAEVLSTQVQLTKEVNEMQKKPKRQLMANELDRMAEAGRV